MKTNKMIINILISSLGFFLGGKLLDGVKQHNFISAIVIAIVVAVLNITLGTVLKFLSLGILSFGIFTLFLDAILILIADWFVKDFEVKNFWWALILALIVSVIEGFIHFFM